MRWKRLGQGQYGLWRCVIRRGNDGWIVEFPAGERQIIRQFIQEELPEREWQNALGFVRGRLDQAKADAEKYIRWRWQMGAEIPKPPKSPRRQPIFKDFNFLAGLTG